MAEPTSSRRGERLLHLGAVLAAPALVVAGVLVGLRPGEAPAVDEQARETAGVVRADRAEPTAATPPASSVPARRPRRVVVPALGVRAAVTPIVAVRRVLTPPADPRRVGWWADGARPGSATGATVLTGHTVSSGGGAFDDLEDLRRGDEVLVLDGTRRSSYAVASVEVLGRGELARRNERVLGRGGPARLVLITCEDWDGTAYLSNVVVTALPTS
ncbi:class F sortase [Nocardioides xinjiangensis]|uniref:class F sortase n=1 Tax=Nocardioides xinjiangensis TaxID=2817376 RepID=UPI0027DB506E|nr:class F sortase [Nocardioides sp. SYSU D00514]